MMKQEFEERANLKVSPECYHTFIEPGYNASNLDKDEWVKEWKKNGGVQAAYDWECAKRIKAEKAAKGAEGEKTNMAKALIKKATYNDVKEKEGYVVLNEKQRAEQAGSMTGHELDQKIEVAKQLLNQLEELGKEFDLKETIKEVRKCIDIYTKERDNARRLALGKNGEFNF